MRGIARSARQLRRRLQAERLAEQTGVPGQEIWEQAAERHAEHHRDPERARALEAEKSGLRPLSRRALLQSAAAMGALAAVGSGSARAAPTAPRIAIVGAGLAGIRAAHWLQTKKGLASTVYEASTRVGGRCSTLRGYFGYGLNVEHGGAFINSDHNALQRLVASLGLTLRVVNGGNQPPFGDIYNIDGSPYSYESANQDWALVWRAFRDAAQSAPYPQTRATATDAGRVLDGQTVNAWIDANIPGGTCGRFGKLMQSNAIAEYGLDPDRQSALNLVYLLGDNSKNSLDPMTGGDELYTVDGGNDQIVSRMIDALPAGTVALDNKLEAVRKNTDGTATLTFRRGSRSVDVTADRVILALPFSTLKNVDLSRAGFSALKLRAIRELGLGTNGKVHIQLARRPWLSQGLGGIAYSEPARFQTVWDDSVNDPGNSGGAVTPQTPGILCHFPGGTQVSNRWTGAAFGPAPTAQVNELLGWIDPVFPGVRAAYQGVAYRDAWHLHPWSKGAYTCPTPGQYTELFGVPEIVEGPFHFAGEHTSSEFYGFLNGAVESGQRAAKEVALAT